MASTFTTNLNLEKPATGELNNTWGGVLRSNWDAQDDAIRGYISISVAGSSDVTLTQAQWRHHTIKLTGVLTGSIEVKFPDSREGCWWIENATTGAFTITCKTVSGTGVVIDQYTKTKIISDATNVEVYEEGIIGEIRMFGFATVPSRWLACTGAAVSRTTFSKLFAKYGTTFGIGDGSTTFNLPDQDGRSPIGVGTGDATNATAWTLGEKGGDESHALIAADFEHNHTGPAHTHAGGSHSHGASGLSTAPPNTFIGGTAGSGAAGAGHGHVINGNTALGGTVATTSSGTGNTGATQNVTSAEHTIMSPVLGMHFFVYAGQ